MQRTKELYPLRRKVAEACRNGWYMGGRYAANIDGHERVFQADSLGWLAKDENAWLASHEEHHANDRLLVRCIEAC